MRIYKGNVSLGYGVPHHEARQAAEAILNIASEIVQAEGLETSHGETLVARIRGLPKLSGQNEVFARGYVRCLQRALIERGAHRQLAVGVAFGSNREDQTSWKIDPSTTVGAIELKITLGHDDGSYGPDLRRNTWSYQRSVADVFLLGKEQV